MKGEARCDKYYRSRLLVTPLQISNDMLRPIVSKKEHKHLRARTCRVRWSALVKDLLHVLHWKSL